MLPASQGESLPTQDVLEDDIAQQQVFGRKAFDLSDLESAKADVLDTMDGENLAVGKMKVGSPKSRLAATLDSVEDDKPCEEVLAAVKQFQATAFHGVAQPASPMSSESRRRPSLEHHSPPRESRKMSTASSYSSPGRDRASTDLTITTQPSYKLGESMADCWEGLVHILEATKWGYEEYIVKYVLQGMTLASKWPSVVVGVQLLIALIFIIIGLATQPMDIDTDFDSFLKTDVESSLAREAFWAADRARPRSAARRLQNAPPVETRYASKDLYLVYKLTDGSRINSLLHERALSDISDFERKLIGNSEWNTLCNRGGPENRRLCDPGISMPGYVLPTMVMNSGGTSPTSLNLDGQGWDPLPIKAAVQLLEDQSFLDMVLPDDYDKTTFPPVRALRSAFRFKIPVGTSAQTSADRKPEVDKAKDDWSKFATETLFPMVKENGENSIFKVYYEGTDFLDIETTEALGKDMLLCIGSVALVCCYLLFHTRSVLLTVLGLIITISAVPMAYVVAAISTGTRTLNFTSFLAVFLVTGFGCDVIFVYTDFWQESSKYFDDLADRLVWCYARAGRASFVTTGTTALSFFANLASVIRALRQFGFFMGLCVMLAWVMLTFIFTPLCVLDERIGIFRFCGKEAGKRRMHYLGEWTRLLRYIKKTCIVVPAVALLAGAVLSGIMIKAGEGMPSLFPEDHNQNAGGDLIEEFFEESGNTAFKNSELTPPAPVSVCGASNFTSTAPCALYWCEVLSVSTSTPTVTIPANRLPEDICDCYRSYSTSDCTGQPISVTMRIITNSSDVTNQIVSSFSWVEDTLRTYANQDTTVALGTKVGTMMNSRQKPVVEHFWESGETTSFSMSKTDLQFQQPPNTTSSHCGWKDICFCGSANVCNLPSGWQRKGTLVLPSIPVTTPATRRLQADASTLLFTPKISKSKRGKVRVAFGLEPNLEVQMLGERLDEEMWSYLPTFESKDPQAQRDISNWCASLFTEENIALRVTKTWCWMEDFKKYLGDIGERFPVPNKNRFDALALQYIQLGAGIYGTPGLKYVWLVDGVIAATYVSVELDWSIDDSSKDILEQKDKWDANIDAFNRQASSSAKGAFHVSKQWVEAEATGKVIWSAIETLIILLALAFFGMVTFTWSIALSMFVVGATLAVISGLSFFMVVIMRWEVGLIEVIALVYFIGYAVTYSLHITHKYAHLEEHDPIKGTDSDQMIGAEEGGALGAGVGALHDEPETKSPGEIRYARTHFAIRSMGAATLGSAATTAGAALFLCFATLTIFQRLGSMCLIVTVLSIYVALGPLPAFLLCCGPLRPGQGGAKWLERCARCCGACGCTGFVAGMMARLGLSSGDDQDSPTRPSSATAVSQKTSSTPVAPPIAMIDNGLQGGKGVGKVGKMSNMGFMGNTNQSPRDQPPGKKGVYSMRRPQLRMSPRRE